MSGYVVDREIGRGGMAVVYAGRHESLDRPVALKVLAAHLAGDREFRERFLREARIAARLEHPHLVRTLDVTEVDGLPCIVMELLAPSTLDGERLTRGEAADVADALAYAHAQGVVHRDLKPGNLLRGHDGAVKIADFGIARAAEETMLTLAGTVLGTLRYLAPEQAEGRPVGPSADVYSLGVVLEELLAEPDRALVSRCLAREPGDRPSAAEVAAALRSAPTVVSSTRVLRRESVSGTPSRRFRSLGTTRLAAAALAALAIVVGVVALASPRGGGSTDVRPVPHATTPAQQAKNIDAWLARYRR